MASPAHWACAPAGHNINKGGVRGASLREEPAPKFKGGVFNSVRFSSDEAARIKRRVETAQASCGVGELEEGEAQVSKKRLRGNVSGLGKQSGREIDFRANKSRDENGGELGRLIVSFCRRRWRLLWRRQ